MKRRDFIAWRGPWRRWFRNTVRDACGARRQRWCEGRRRSSGRLSDSCCSGELGKKLEAATNGRLSTQMFGSMQLGGEKEMIEQAQIGALQFARVSVGTLGPVVDDLNALNIPFLCRNTAHMQKVLDGDIGSELLDKVTSNANANLVGLCWMDAGARSFYTTKKPIKTIDDLKGQKVRRHRQPDVRRHGQRARRQWRRVMGYDQVFNALQTGVIDGAENNPPSYVFDNHFTVAKYTP